MRMACIKNGLVENVIIADQSFADMLVTRGDYSHVIEVSDDPGSPGIGWSYDGATFSPPA